MNTQSLAPHEEVITTDSPVSPGDGYVLLDFPLGGKPLVFKAFGAERVDGIDYDSFEIHSVFVGQARQWHAWAGGNFWPATDLFKKWDAPMDAVQTGMSITISFRNTSKKPQKFAVKFVGKKLK